ncbi:protein of unknown function [Tenacibaculum aestuariivivum]
MLCLILLQVRILCSKDIVKPFFVHYNRYNVFMASQFSQNCQAFTTRFFTFQDKKSSNKPFNPSRKAYFKIRCR